MKKVFLTIICIMLMFAMLTNPAFAQLSYTVEDIDADIPGLISLAVTGFYKFERDGKEYYTSKSGTAIKDYRKDEFDFFVKGLKNSTYIWTGQYYMIIRNDVSYDEAYNTDMWKYSNGKILFYDEKFNLVNEYSTHAYITNWGYSKGKYFYLTRLGLKYTSTDTFNWTSEGNSITYTDEDYIHKWSDIYISDRYDKENKLFNYMSLDGENYYNISFEKNCNQMHGLFGEHKCAVSPYMIRHQRWLRDDEGPSWIGFSKDNVYYTYFDLNSVKSDMQKGDRFSASKILAVGDYLYMYLAAYHADDMLIKIPLSEIDAELDAMEDAPIVVYDNTILGFEQAPVIDEGRTLIPIRFLFEKMGATVDWNGETQTATITQNNTAVAFSIDDTEADVNGQTVSMDVPAKLVNGKTMVPVRFLSENLGYTVGWDEDNRIITIE